MASFPLASPLTPCAHLSPLPYVPHDPPISFFSILPPAQYWVRNYRFLWQSCVTHKQLCNILTKRKVFSVIPSDTYIKSLSLKVNNKISPFLCSSTNLNSVHIFTLHFHSICFSIICVYLLKSRYAKRCFLLTFANQNLVWLFNFTHLWYMFSPFLLTSLQILADQPRGLMVRVSDYWLWGSVSIPGSTMGILPWRERFPWWPWSG
jgi:hypothetical protein